MSSIGSYYHNTYNIDINHSSIAFLFETHYFEAIEFINTTNSLWILLSLFIALFWIFFIKLKPLKKPHYAFSAFFLSFFIIINFGIFDTKWYRNIYPDIAKHMRYKKIFPVNVFKSIKGYYREIHKMKAMGPLIDCSTFPSTRQFDDDVNIIVILGESARADHFQLNGYQRTTTPLLASENNLVNFPKTASFAACTRYSIPIIISPADSTQPENRYSSFIDIFKKYGYETYWFSLNDSLGTNNNPITRLIKTVDNAVFRESLHIDYKKAKDTTLLPLFFTTIKKNNTPKVIVLHTRGSHYDYSKRYEKQFQKFIPDKPGNDNFSKNQIIKNAYDNSIIATDAFIHSVIDHVKHLNAAVIYISDHGESLGEDGYYNHGNPKRTEQRIVPFFIWCSETYVNFHQDKFENLQKNACLQVSHDYIFPTILGLAGISSQIKRDELDLTSDHPLSGSGTAEVSFPPMLRFACKK
jgi:glucan phosphoethanolaminetransferase (alkaline phosphatase superfamily)